MKHNKIIFDCDIGCDDAVALVSLLTNNDLEVIAITCVKGNIPVDDVVDNALKVSHLCGKDVPVYKGCESPMVRDLLKGRDYNTLMERIRMEIDGKEVLIHEKEFPLPLPERKAEDRHACSYLIETLKDAEEKIDICAIGPLTNIAMAIRLEPKIIEHIGTLYIMGGGLYIGNRTPVAEANFYDDPEAAEIVLNSGAHCLVCPIEACEEGAAYSRKDLEELAALNTPAACFLAEELDGYIRRCDLLFGAGLNDCCIYDYAAVVPLIDETVITDKRREIVHVDISGGMADGQMVVDRRGMFKNESNVEIIYHMDKDKIRQILLDQLKNA
ncbi:MAG: nucleoside hydrolase [Erysipelotrichaceae bacterium]|nr:nucleoside hydrolase [Erysipelotrichaceae bacterium]